MGRNLNRTLNRCANSFLRETSPLVELCAGEQTVFHGVQPEARDDGAEPDGRPQVRVRRCGRWAVVPQPDEAALLPPPQRPAAALHLCARPAGEQPLAPHRAHRALHPAAAAAVRPAAEQLGCLTPPVGRQLRQPVGGHHQHHFGAPPPSQVGHSRLPAAPCVGCWRPRRAAAAAERVGPVDSHDQPQARTSRQLLPQHRPARARGAADAANARRRRRPLPHTRRSARWRRSTAVGVPHRRAPVARRPCPRPRRRRRPRAARRPTLAHASSAAEWAAARAAGRLASRPPRDGDRRAHADGHLPGQTRQPGLVRAQVLQPLKQDGGGGGGGGGDLGATALDRR